MTIYRSTRINRSVQPWGYWFRLPNGRKSNSFHSLTEVQEAIRRADLSIDAKFDALRAVLA